MKNSLKDFYFERELKIKKIAKISLLIIFIVALITLIVLYIVRQDFRRWVDITILRKDITTSDIASIDLATNKNNQIYCYGNNVCILNDKNLKIYNPAGDEVTDISVDINTAVFDSNGKYLAIAEKNGQNLCTIFDKTFLWKQQVDGEILHISINKNGYVAVVTTDSTYKSIITLYDQNGKSVLKNYLSSSRVVDVSISNDNKYVAFAELDTMVALIQSNIKIISVDKALENAKEAIIYTYNADTSEMIVNINYQDKGALVCHFDDSIKVINSNNIDEKLKIDKNCTFSSCDLNNSFVYINEQNSGIFNSKSVLNITNTLNGQNKIYNLSEVIKEMYAYNNIIGVNVGAEIYFINANGMLIKKYTSKQEISNVILSEELGIIIYKDKIEIIEF